MARCEFLGECSIFGLLGIETVRDMWRRLYCHSPGGHDQCAIKKYHLCGDTPPENLLPHGKLIRGCRRKEEENEENEGRSENN